MSDLLNPLFDEEKEFLERKKLEYERALRGDVDHIKEQSVKVGKVALVGAGLAGSVWLIAKAFSGKGKRKKSKRYAETGDNRADFEPDGFDDDNGFGSDAEYFTAGNGKRYRSVIHHKSAADSAHAFMNHPDAYSEHGHESDDSGFGFETASQLEHDYGQDQNDYRRSHDEDQSQAAGALFGGNALASSPFDPEEFEDDPFKDLPYDDSRRLPVSHDFDDEDDSGSYENHVSPRSNNMVGKVLQSFLKSDTGKMLVAQAAAVALAMVTKKVSEFFPADKNPDLAASPAYAPVETGFSPAVSLASPDSPDASTHSSSI